MQTLKDLTWENHTKAEKTIFIKTLVKQKLTPHQYYFYLANQAVMYYSLEEYADMHKLFKPFPEIKRSYLILDDLKNIEKEYGFSAPIHAPTTKKYLEHIRLISDNPHKLMAHIYVRHMGDLSGGQIIQRFVPVEYKRFYQFESNPHDLKEKLRQSLSINMADEANLCFDYMINFFHDLEKQFDLGNTSESI
jgi:heme oxygenase (biliverdin-producing, ferredoxin)